MPRLYLVVIIALVIVAGCSTLTNVYSIPQDYRVAADTLYLIDEDSPRYDTVGTLIRGATVKVAKRYHNELSGEGDWEITYNGKRVRIPGDQLLSEYDYTRMLEDDQVSSSGGATGAGHDIKTGPRGGKYYINKNGNKTYVKKGK